MNQYKREENYSSLVFLFYRDYINKKSQKHYLLQHNSKIYQIKKHAHSAKHPFQRAKLNTY